MRKFRWDSMLEHVQAIHSFDLTYEFHKYSFTFVVSKITKYPILLKSKDLNTL